MPSAFLYCRGKSKRGSNQSWCPDSFFSTFCGHLTENGTFYMIRAGKLTAVSKPIVRMPESVCCRSQPYS